MSRTILALFFGFRLIVPMWYKSSFWPTILQSDNQTNSVKDPLVPSVRTINLETHSRHPHDPWIVDTTRPTTTSHSLFIPSGRQSQVSKTMCSSSAPKPPSHKYWRSVGGRTCQIKKQMRNNRGNVNVLAQTPVPCGPNGKPSRR